MRGVGVQIFRAFRYRTPTADLIRGRVKARSDVQTILRTAYLKRPPTVRANTFLSRIDFRISLELLYEWNQGPFRHEDVTSTENILPLIDSLADRHQGVHLLRS